jgi:hypothetical protein
MQTANILLMLGGDRDNQIPKYGVTASEVAVLRLIHGDESVTDIEPTGELKRSSKEERQRLTDIYSRVQPNGVRKAVEVDALFPGAAARVFETFDELDIDESMFKAETRVSAKKASTTMATARRAARSSSRSAARRPPRRKPKPPSSLKTRPKRKSPAMKATRTTASAT